MSADDIYDEQRAINAKRRAMAEAIIAAAPFTTIDEAKRYAQFWIETAAQHCDNETYWKDRALAAESKIGQIAAVLEPAPSNRKESPR